MNSDTSSSSLYIKNPIVRPQILMAGPCSAETEAQVLEVAQALSQQGVDYFRAGIWKPRTHPGSFEGVGAEGLAWLQKAKSLYGLKVATEVATPKHVEEALKYGIDLLWIGARTTVNPFAVQEIADALQGVDVPVMIKNPVNPDLSLWIGAVKRIENAGIHKVFACHRGFNIYEKSRFRNPPLWAIPLEFKHRYPHIPMICDPSHICGTRELLASTAQKAMDLGFDGLIIETHPTPDKALSDAAQQITPDRFSAMIAQLHYRTSSSDDVIFNSRLGQLRQEIDEIDERLLELLAARMGAVQKANVLKSQNGVSVFNPNRWTELQTHCKQTAQKLGLPEAMVLDIFDKIHVAALELGQESA